MTETASLGVLVSGRGSNLEAILDAGLDVALVACNRAGARALQVAGARRVRTLFAPRSDFPSLDERDGAIGAAMTAAGVGLVVLAGWDQLLRRPYFDAYAGRTINIHPSLLPAHGGRGMVGAAVHESVLAAGDPETGVTIHEVTRDLDAGPILAQERIPVRADETVDSLADRVLRHEHRLLVATIRSLLAAG